MEMERNDWTEEIRSKGDEVGGAWDPAVDACVIPQGG